MFTRLTFTFFKIGLLTVGGGLAIIPIVQHEMITRGWLTHEQFIDIVGIAQMTPGPVAVNTATFVGYRVVSLQGFATLLAIAGAALATFAVCAPSIIGAHIGGSLWERWRDNPCILRVFAILRPAVTGLILAAGVLMAFNCFDAASVYAIDSLTLDVQTLGILLFSFGFTAFTRVSVFWIFGVAAALGLARYTIYMI